MMLVTAIRKNYERFTRREVVGMIAARQLQGMIGNPSKYDFEGMVHANMINKCPITADLVKGKTIRKPPQRVITDCLNPIRV